MQCERSWRPQPRTAPLYVLNVPDDTNPTALITTSAPPLVMAVPYVHTHHRNKKLCYRRRTSRSTRYVSQNLVNCTNKCTTTPQQVAVMELEGYSWSMSMSMSVSMWSLRWHFTNKPIAGAPYSINSYSLSHRHSWTQWQRVRWLKQCRPEVAGSRRIDL